MLWPCYQASLPSLTTYPTNTSHSIHYLSQNIAGLASLLSSAVDADAAEELYQRSDPPLGHAVDPAATVAKRVGGNGGFPTTTSKKAFIISDYNRDGDSHRSPWSNVYYPPIESDGFQPSPQLRQVETMANEVFDSYRSLYYGSGDSSVASVYLWDREGADADGGDGERGGGFAGAFLIKKEIKEEEADQYMRKATWNSVHVVEVIPSPEGRTASYGMTTTISLIMEPNTSSLATDGSGRTCISGSLTKRSDRVLSISTNGLDGAEHIANIGKMIEDVEIEMRSSMDSLHIQKTRYVVDSVRTPGEKSNHRGSAGGVQRGGAPAAFSNQQRVATLLTEAVLARQANKS